jgi:flagellar biosynthetic protein FliP
MAATETGRGARLRLLAAPLGLGLGLLLAGPAAAAAAPAGGTGIPAVTIGVGAAQGPGQVATTVEILLGLTVLSLAPAVLLLMTSFTRIVVVLGFARTALGSGQLPPNQILVGLALFLTLFVMAPTFSQIYTTAWQPYQAGTIDLPTALERAQEPLRAFMLRQTRPADLQLFEDLQRRASGGTGAPSGGQAGAAAAVPLQVLVPAFVISELRVAFEMGFVLFVPFVVIDLVVASTLMAMGMVMLPPMLISLPFKILLFVLVDGWRLLAQSLVQSFR